MRQLFADDFTPARYPVTLAADEIQLWLFRSDGRPRTNAEDEARTRALLADYLGCRPDRVGLGRGEHGKPFLLDSGLADSRAFEFNVSHSGGALLVGIAAGQALGVDIETPRRRRPVLELARRFFAEDEARALAQLDEKQQQIAFLRVWSCKEAVVKALGSGVGFGLARLQFGIDPAGEPRALSVIHDSAGTPRDWHIVRLELDTQVGALAWRGPPRRVRAFVAAVE